MLFPYHIHNLFLLVRASSQGFIRLDVKRGEIMTQQAQACDRNFWWMLIAKPRNMAPFHWSPPKLGVRGGNQQRQIMNDHDICDISPAKENSCQKKCLKNSCLFHSPQCPTRQLLQLVSTCSLKPLLSISSASSKTNIFILFTLASQEKYGVRELYIYIYIHTYFSFPSFQSLPMDDDTLDVF